MVFLFRVITLVFLAKIQYLHGLPPQAGEQEGPCVGMDCLHGVLMHNDEKEGEEHKTEDQYLRFKEALDTGEKPEIGTKATEDELHKVLMHGGHDDHHEEGATLLPELAVEQGPRDPNEMLHEVMHGEEGVGKHDWDGEQDEVRAVHEPVNGDRMMHDLMHGGAAHVDGPSATETAEGDTNKVVGPDGGDELMHGVLMHGDKDHKHGTEPDRVDAQETGDIRPLDGSSYMHGVLMHGDAESGKPHEHEDHEHEDEGDAQSPGPRTGDLHGILMHGDAEIGKDHSHEDSKSSESEPFSDILEILNMELDEQLLRVIDIERLLKKDKEEYEEWILNNPHYQDEGLSGSTNIDVGDSLLSDIDVMKNRYLESNNDAVAKADDEFPFTAEDAEEVLESGSAEPGENEDMRHFLELLGSTEPLNARHKVQQELWKSKLSEKDEH